MNVFNNNLYGQNGSNLDADKRMYNDGPVIVDHIMKYQEENIPTIHQVQEVKILPEPIAFTVHESSFEVKENFPETDKSFFPEETLNSNKHYKEQITLLPDKLDFIHSDEKTVEPSILIETIKFDPIETQKVDTALSLPTNVNVYTKENKGSIFKNSLEKNDTENIDNEKKIQKLKVGKLNLDLWNEQVSANKQLVSKPKSVETSLIRAQKIISTKAIDIEVPKKTESQNELIYDDNTSDTNKNETLIPLPVEIKSEDPPEMPIILPCKKDLLHNIKSNETPTLLPERINFATNDGKLQVPIILPETPLTVSSKLKFEDQRSQTEVSTAIEYTTEFNTNIYKAETTNIIQYTNTTENEDKNSIETPGTLSGKIESAGKETNFENSKILPEPIDFKISEDEENIQRLVPGKDDLNSYLKVDQFIEKPKLRHNIDLYKEIPSDPELVDSEPEIRETKDTIMGKLQNKVFLTTDRNHKNNKAIYYTEKSSNPTTPTIADNDNKTKFYPIYKENTDANHDLETTQDIKDISVRNKRFQNNVPEYDEYDSREDIKRTKSLAELDLGDAVKGQVQRMVYRIKSVDFDRIETTKARKISLREMPKKSSVLEKIALFEVSF